MGSEIMGCLPNFVLTLLIKRKGPKIAYQRAQDV